MKEKEEMTQERFLELIKKAARKDTSYDRANWRKENPLWGHCAIVALLAQRYFGGFIIRGSLETIPELAHLRSHYWNKTPKGHVDFTREQFSIALPKIETSVRGRVKILAYPEVEKRYHRFVSRFNKLL